MGSGVTGSRAPRRHAQLRSASISTKGLIITKKKRHRPSSRLPENFLKGEKKKKKKFGFYAAVVCRLGAALAGPRQGWRALFLSPSFCPRYHQLKDQAR